MKTMPQNIFVSALFPPQRPLLCRGEAKKKARKRLPTGLLLCDYGYPARASAEEVSATKKGARK